MTDTPRARAFLDGIRVLDVTGALAGPYCTTILADMGAEVIKVEPTEGDSLRRRTADPANGALAFDLVHRDKKSLAIDLKSRAGKRILVEMARRSDVLVENFSVGVLTRLGLGYEDLRPECPNLVYCSISGFGQSGPMRDAKGIDLIAQAYGGLMSVTGSDDGRLAKAGFPVSDLGAGMWAAIGVLAALVRAGSGGGGGYVDVSLADTIASWSLWEIADYMSTGVVPEPLGTAHRLAAPYQAFNCGDGQLIAVGAVERSWPRLCAVLDLDLSTDDRFATEYERFRHRKQLAEILDQRFMQEPRDHWIDWLRDAGVPCGPVNSIDAVVGDPQFKARGMFPQDEERHGATLLVNTPVMADGAPRARGRAPRLGESAPALLAELGYGPKEIEDLVAAGVIALAATDTNAGSLL
ncbi:CaiB/BaiF CoA-transferase family protein [Mycobacterium sp. 1465703.0]|uniref:CaiB/BaiF CoA transferase family protein n=1 Tax=Mycobacterium sp. 1465703.0 TaxID=1834078 RepID=UPI0007FC452A|nr:CaiB/BaiF CoA-transferase family protein [Mycobacterium sp. 1465703.0]OBJ08867.1 acyl-CoA transferase [Mycobacterium sp. 1465703.0]